MRTTPLPSSRPSRPRPHVGRDNIELDPYLLDETALTLDDWRHRPPADDSDAQVVRFHQHHNARLVA